MTQPAPAPPVNVRLYSDTSAQPPQSVCLDANIVLDLYEHELAMIKAPRMRAQPDLVGCLMRLRGAACKLFVNLQVLEEVFHVLKRWLLDGMLGKYGCTDKKAFAAKRRPLTRRCGRTR